MAAEDERRTPPERAGNAAGEESDTVARGTEPAVRIDANQKLPGRSRSGEADVGGLGPPAEAGSRAGGSEGQAASAFELTQGPAPPAGATFDA